MKIALKLLCFCLVALKSVFATSGVLFVYDKANGQVVRRCNGTVVNGGAVITKANCLYDYYKNNQLSHIEFYPDYNGERDYNSRAFRAMEIYIPNDYIIAAQDNNLSAELMRSNIAILKMYRDDIQKWLKNSDVKKSLFSKVWRYPNFDRSKTYNIYMASHIREDGTGVAKRRYNCEAKFGERFLNGLYPTTCYQRAYTGEGAYLYHKESDQIFMIGLMTGGYGDNLQLLTTWDDYYDSMDTIIARGIDPYQKFEKLDFNSRATYSLSIENDCLAINGMDITIVARNSFTNQLQMETIRDVQAGEVANFRMRTHNTTWYYYAKEIGRSGDIIEWGKGDKYYEVDGVAKPFTKKSLNTTSGGEGTWINQRQRLTCNNV